MSGVRRVAPPLPLPPQGEPPNATVAAEELERARHTVERLQQERARVEAELRNAQNELALLRSLPPAPWLVEPASERDVEAATLTDHAVEPIEPIEPAGASACLQQLMVRETAEPIADTDAVADSSDRRNTERTPCAFEVEFVQESHFFAGLSQDLSSGGIFVATYQVVDVGTRLTLSFELPGCGPITIEGEVRWVRDESEGGSRPGLGVAFVDVDPRTLERVRAFCGSRPPLYFDV